MAVQARKITLCSPQEWCVWPDPIENWGSAALEMLLHIGPSSGQESCLLKDRFISWVFCLVALLTLIWKQKPWCSWLLLSTQLFFVVTVSKIRWEAPKLAGSLCAVVVPGENAVAMQLETQTIAKPWFVFLCFLLWISTQVIKHSKPGVTKGHEGTVLWHEWWDGASFWWHLHEGAHRTLIHNVPELFCV